MSTVECSSEASCAEQANEQANDQTGERVAQSQTSEFLSVLDHSGPEVEKKTGKEDRKRRRK